MTWTNNPLLVLWRRRNLACAVFVAVWAAVILSLALIPSRYVAIALISLIEPLRAFDKVAPIYLGDPSDIESQVYIAESVAVLRAVLQSPEARDAAAAECRSEAGFFSSQECSGFAAATPDAIAYLRERYAVNGAGRSRVLYVKYNSSNPQTAALMANRLAEAIITTHQDELTQKGSKAIEALTAQVTELDREIREKTAFVEAYRTRKGLVSGEKAALTSEQLTSVSNRLATAEAERFTARSILEAIRQGSLDNATTINLGIDNPGLYDIQRQLNAAQAAAEAAALNLGPKHPQLQMLRSKVASLDQSYRTELKRIESAAQEKLDAAEGVVSALNAQLGGAKSEASDARDAASSIEDSIRDLEAKKRYFVELSVEKQKLVADTFAAPGRLHLNSKADVPTDRFFPKTIPFVSGGFALALVMAVVVTIVVDNLSRRSRPPTVATAVPPRLAGRTPLPLMGTLSLADLPGRHLFAQALDNMKHGQCREVVDLLVGELMTKSQMKRPLSLAVLSAFASPQRSLFAAMLAIAAAERSYRVLLVDADLRSGWGDRLSRWPRGPGLQDMLDHRVPPDDLMQDLATHIDFIGAGEGRLDSSNEFDLDVIASLIEWGRGYDLILFDCPPLDGSMDGGLIAGQVRASLITTSMDQTEREATLNVATRLQELGLDIRGYVVAQTRPAETLHRVLAAASRLPEKRRAMP